MTDRTHDGFIVDRDFGRVIDAREGRTLTGHETIGIAEGLAVAGFRRAMLEEIDQITGGSAADPETEN